MNADVSDARYGTACATSSGCEAQWTGAPATGAGAHGTRVNAAGPGRALP